MINYKDQDNLQRSLETMKLYKKHLKDRDIEYKANKLKYSIDNKQISNNISSRVLNSFHNVIKVL